MSLLPYPLRCQPLFRDYLWGGRKLQSQLGKDLPAEGVWAESWELIDHAEHESQIINGALAGQTLGQVAREHPQWLVGEPSAREIGGPGQPQIRLPLLLKYLDCQRVLSVQVHPDDAYGLRMQPPDLGKTEAWYIVDAEPSSVLYAGLKHGVTRQRLQAAIASGTVEACLHPLHPRAGDCVFIPAGTVHALGAGLLVAEIQQASNTTFRLFDWNRVGADGKSRPLHVEQALEVIDFSSGPREFQVPQATSQPGRERLVACDKFIFDRLVGQAAATVAGDGRFHYVTAPRGQVVLSSDAGWREELRAGESVLLPAVSPRLDVSLAGDGVLLDMYLPN